MAADVGEARSTTQLRPPPLFGYSHPPRPVAHHHHHYHHFHHQHPPYELHHQPQPRPQERMSDPEPAPYVKTQQEWEWEWRGKEEYVEPGEAEKPDWREQYERPLAREGAMQAEPMQAEPARATVCSMFCMSPHGDFEHASRGVGHVFRVICVPFCASGHAHGSNCTVVHAFGVPSTGPRADKDRSITPLEQRRSPVPVKTEEAETESAYENVMLEVGVSSCSVSVHVPRVAFFRLQPCF